MGRRRLVIVVERSCPVATSSLSLGTTCLTGYEIVLIGQQPHPLQMHDVCTFYAASILTFMIL